jgi:hypothetical protein
VNDKPANALILQFIDTRHSPRCFGTLKCHHQGVKHDPAETGAKCRGKQRRMEAVCCNRRRDDWDKWAWGDSCLLLQLQQNRFKVADGTIIRITLKILEKA